jgi:hypothetical protein
LRTALGPGILQGLELIEKIIERAFDKGAMDDQIVAPFAAPGSAIRIDDAVLVGHSLDFDADVLETLALAGRSRAQAKPLDVGIRKLFLDGSIFVDSLQQVSFEKIAGAAAHAAIIEKQIPPGSEEHQRAEKPHNPGAGQQPNAFPFIAPIDHRQSQANDGGNGEHQQVSQQNQDIEIDFLDGEFLTRRFRAGNAHAGLPV